MDETLKLLHSLTLIDEEVGMAANAMEYPPYHPEAAALARQRTLDFLGQHLGGNAP